MARIESRTRIAQSEAGVTASSHSVQNSSGQKVKLPFLEDRDDLEAYLSQFERIATINGWDESEWGTRLAPLLKGRARDAFIHLPIADSADYQVIKKSLLHRYQLNALSYRQKFRNTRKEVGEENNVFWDRLSTSLFRWIELSEKQESDLAEMIIMERFLEAQPAEEARFIRERNPRDKNEAIRAANLFEETRQAEGRNREGRTARPPFRSSESHKPREGTVRPQFAPYRPDPSKDRNRGWRDKDNSVRSGPPQFLRQSTAGCFKCGGPHLRKYCTEAPRTAFVTTTIAPVMCKTDKSLCGKCSQIEFDPHCVVKVEGQQAQAIRDTGATITVVSSDLVPRRCYARETKTVTLASSKVKQDLPTAIVDLETPYFSGKTEVIVMDTPVVPVLIGNTRTSRDKEILIPVYPKSEQIQETIAAAGSKSTVTGTPVIKPLRVKESSLSDVTPEELRAAQGKDKTLAKLIAKARKGDSGICRANGVRSHYVLKKGILHRKVKVVNRDYNQVVVPSCYRAGILKIAHDLPMAGHLGVRRTKDRILTNFYWPGIDTSVKNYCLSCDACQRCVGKHTVRKAPLQQVPIITTPFKKIAVDLVGPINPASSQGNRYILTVMDYATKYAEAVPLHTTDSVTVAEALWQIWSRVGIPDEIVSDRGSQFISQVMREVHRLLSIKGIATTPYHAQANGLVERFNGTLKTMIRKLCIEQPQEWDRYVPALLFAYRETPQESTKFSPFELLYGRTIRGPMHVLKKCWTDDETDDETRTIAEYVTELRNRMEHTCQIARDNLKLAQSRYTKNYDQRAKRRVLEVDSLVLALLPDKHCRLQLSWKGPFKVVKKLNEVDYVIQLKGKEKVYHLNLLKQYHERKSEELQSVSVVIQEDFDSRMKTDHIPLIPLTESETYEDVTYSPELKVRQKAEMEELVSVNRAVFTDIPGDTSLEECGIRLMNKEPVRVQQYPLAHSQTETVKKEVEQMITMGVIERASSPYNAPIVLVKKKDDTVRFCIDYRRLNTVTEFDAEPMPDIDGIFAQLNKAKYFTKVDLSKGFWQIPMKEEDRPKTAFSTPQGQFQWKKMPFGMKNATAVFSRMMRKLLGPLNLKDVHNFMDDILIASETWEGHLKAVAAVLKRLRQAGLTAKPSKCYMGFQELSFLGHLVGNGEIRPEEDKTEKLREAERPQTKKQLRSFLGLANYYRKFVPNFAEIATPLTDGTKKGKPETVQWDEECESAFNSLKDSLTTKPVIVLPDKDKEYTLRTDASDRGIGAILLQQHDGDLRPVAYASKKLSQAEINYSTIEKECLGVIWGINKFEPYLFGNHFVLETDHRPLEYLKRSKTDNGRLMRWALQLQQHSFTLRVIPGVDNVGADYLSRV